MYLPKLNQPARARSSLTAFYGLDTTPACGEGWLAGGENLSAADFPVLSPRLPRVLTQTLAAPAGLYAKNGLLWAAGGRLYYDGQDVGPVTQSPKQFCGMGSKVLIWPDKLCFDTAARTLTALAARWQARGDVTFRPCLSDGTGYTPGHTGPGQPENPAGGDYWLDTSTAPHTLRVYSAATGSWAAVAAACIAIAGAGIGASFKAGDAIALSGVSAAVLGQDAADGLNTTLHVWLAKPDLLVVSGLLEAAATQTTAQGRILAERRVPDLDFITQQDNRVWGCCSADHTIYACKLGDPTNWYSYTGTAADSYAVTVGSDGDFTGAASCMGYVLLFKPGCIHKVYGTKPANYQVTTVAAPGVAAGAAGTLVQAGGALYYRSPQGIMRYDGSLPVCVSDRLGRPDWQAGAAGADGPVLYFSLQEDGAPALYTYHTERGLWHKERAPAFTHFAWQGSRLYALAADGGVWQMGRARDAADTPGREGPVPWTAQTGPIGMTEPDSRFVSRIALKLEAAPGSTVALAARWDDGPWQPLAGRSLAGGGSILWPILPRRCSHMRLRITGTGPVRLYGLYKVMERGSEL